MTDPISQTPAQNLRLRRKRALNLGVDVPLLLAVFTLVVFGLLMVFSASWDFSFFIYEDHTHMFRRQLLYLGIGLSAAVFTSWLDYHHWRRLAVPLLGVVLVGLFGVLLAGEVRYGATRTLNQGSYMPSEAAKMVTVIYLAVWLYAKRNQLREVKFGLVPLGGIIGLIGALILMQPDISAAFTIMFLGGMLFFLAGGELKQIFLLMVTAMVIGWILILIQPTAKARVADYVSGIKDPTQASYHVRRSIESFVRGGVFGLGIGNAETKLTGLPVPPTDSIFAVVAEETGLLGTTFLVGLYSVLAYRGLSIARKAPDLLGTFLASGLTFWILLEAVINMAVMVGLLPIAGNALPFISYGGSSLVVTLASIGILMNISRRSQLPEKTPRERIEYASDGFRRSDRRRDQPRPRRVTGSW